MAASLLQENEKEDVVERNRPASHALRWRALPLAGKLAMNRRPRLPGIAPTQLLVAAVLIICTGRVFAAAAWLTEAGGADMGMAGAGRGALAEDAAALVSNPAAIGALPESMITVAILPLALDLSFNGDGNTPGHASDKVGVVPLGSAFAVHRADRLTLGLGVYSYLGLSFDFGEEWVGARVIEKAGFRSINIAPAIAYRLTDRVQVGATVAAQYADVDAALAVSNSAAYYGPPVGLPDGRLDMTGHSWAPAGSVGVLFSPSPETRLGVAWTSAVHHSAALDLTGHDLHPVLATMLPPPGQVKLDLPLPQQLTLSATHRLTAATTLGATVGWQDWSAFGHAKMAFPGPDAPLFPDGLRDTWSAALGVRQQVGDGWGWSAGVAYDSDPSASGTVPAYFPTAEQLRVAAGIERRLSETCTVRIALSVVNQARARVVQDSHPLPLPGTGLLTGDFEPSRVYILGVAADFRP
jgi:long-chain fatty acid transport protein